jgi:hypothetical protein
MPKATGTKVSAKVVSTGDSLVTAELVDQLTESFFTTRDVFSLVSELKSNVLTLQTKVDHLNGKIVQLSTSSAPTGALKRESPSRSSRVSVSAASPDDDDDDGSASADASAYVGHDDDDESTKRKKKVWTREEEEYLAALYEKFYVDGKAFSWKKLMLYDASEDGYGWFEDLSNVQVKDKVWDMFDLRPKKKRG